MPKLLFGVAECDKGEFKTKKSRAYTTWFAMIRRCYCPKTQETKPTYVGCSVDQRFLKFQSFAAWATSQFGFENEWQLDKDILCPGNKTYGPDTCIFVPPEINKAFRRVAVKLNGLPIGVTYSLRSKQFRASVCINDGYEHIGHYDSVEQAYKAHLKRKCEHLRELAKKWRTEIPNRLYDALIDRIAEWEFEFIT